MKWLGIVLFLAGLVLVLVGVTFVTIQPWNTIITHLGSVAIGAGMVELVIRFYTTQRLIEYAVERILSAMRLPIASFYENRNALVPLSDELKNISELWAAWHSGTVAHHITGIFGPGRVTKASVILTHPESNQMKELQKVAEKNADALSSDIREFTKALKQQNVTVKWFDGPVCNSVIIANPEKDDAWARVEVLVPTQSAGKRPSFRVEKTKNKELFNAFYDAFKKMWDASEPPP